MANGITALVFGETRAPAPAAFTPPRCVADADADADAMADADVADAIAIADAIADADAVTDAVVDADVNGLFQSPLCSSNDSCIVL